MLSKEDLSRIVKDEVENEIRKGKISTDDCTYYYILLDGKIYPRDDYDEEVAKGIRSPNDIYAYVCVYTSTDFDDFLFYIDYLDAPSVMDFVEAYLRKIGFTIGRFYALPPTPNLKYFIHVGFKLNNDTPEYLVIDIYDIDSLARTLHIPQIVEQKLGNKPREITYDDADDIWHAFAYDQPLLAGYTYKDAWNILEAYYVNHKKKYKKKANKIVLAYSQLFPSPYRVCYEWKARTFDKIDCLKIELRRFSS